MEEKNITAKICLLVAKLCQSKTSKGCGESDTQKQVYEGKKNNEKVPWNDCVD